MEASKLAKIPEDLIVEFLLRLPVKSLLSSKLVCKKWYEFIKSNRFKLMHHKFNLGTRSPRFLMCSSPKSQVNQSINNHQFTIHSNHDELSSTDFGILANTDTYVYLVPESCNGIVCYYDDDSNIFLCNPATREFKQLPPTSFETSTDPKLYQCGVGFGFDSTDIYDLKVLRFFGIMTTSKRGIPGPKPTHKAFRAEIFTLSSNTWNQIHWDLEEQFRIYNGNSLFSANSFHFIANRYKSEEQAIVCFDINTHTFRTMDLPLSGKANFTSLIVFKKFLSTTVGRFLSKFKQPTDIWIMKDYGVAGSWTKLYTICPLWIYSAPLCFLPEKDVLLWRNATEGLSSSHADTLKFDPIKIDGHNGYSQYAVYQETLVSIL